MASAPEPEPPIAEAPLPERLPIASLQPPPIAVDDAPAPIALTHRLVLPDPAHAQIAAPPQPAPDPIASPIASPDVAGLVLTVPRDGARPVVPPTRSAARRVEQEDAAPSPERSPHDATIVDSEEAPERRRSWSPILAVAAIILLVTCSVFAVRAILAPVPAAVAKSGVWRTAAPRAAGAAGAESTAATTDTPPTLSATTAGEPGAGKANEDSNAKNPAGPAANDGAGPGRATAPAPPPAGGPPAQPQAKPKKSVYEPLGI